MKKAIPKKLSGLSTSSPEYLFEEVKEWKSELDFYKAELTFLNNLLDKNFLGEFMPKDISTISALSKSLESKRTSTLPILIKKVWSYESTLGKIVEGFPVKSKSKFMTDHNKTKLEVFVFINEMRILKKKIFRIAEKKIAEEKKITSGYMEGSLAL